MKINSLLIAASYSVLAQYAKDPSIERPEIVKGSEEQVQAFLTAAGRYLDVRQNKGHGRLEEELGTLSLRFYDAYDHKSYHYLWSFEKKLQFIDNSVRVSSWNYTKHAGKYDVDPVFLKGGFGDKHVSGCPKKFGAFLQNECEKRSPDVFLDPGFISEDAILKEKDIQDVERLLTENYQKIAKVLWGETFLPLTVGSYDTLAFPIFAHNLKVLAKWGEKHNANIDYSNHHPISKQSKPGLTFSS